MPPVAPGERTSFTGKKKASDGAEAMTSARWIIRPGTTPDGQGAPIGALAVGDVATATVIQRLATAEGERLRGLLAMALRDSDRSRP